MEKRVGKGMGKTLVENKGRRERDVQYGARDKFLSAVVAG